MKMAECLVVITMMGVMNIGIVLRVRLIRDVFGCVHGWKIFGTGMTTSLISGVIIAEKDEDKNK
jgi:hypothetical protein